jgi:hypothetical protein
MVRARAPTMRWLVIVAALVIGPAANAEGPIHLACEGEMSAMKAGTIGRLDEKYLMSLAIDLSARTVKPEGHPSVPLKPVDDEDIVAFASPRASDDVLDGRVNRITGEALIHFLTDPMFEFHGRCHRAESLF